MPDYNELLTNDTLDTGRAKIRNSINEIAAELNSALVAEGLAYPVYICVPSSGNALATLAWISHARAGRGGERGHHRAF